MWRHIPRLREEYVLSRQVSKTPQTVAGRWGGRRTISWKLFQRRFFFACKFYRLIDESFRNISTYFNIISVLPRPRHHRTALQQHAPVSSCCSKDTVGLEKHSSARRPPEAMSAVSVHVTRPQSSTWALLGPLIGLRLWIL